MGKEKRYCVVCGRELRTGRKYCYEHRGTRNYRSDEWDFPLLRWLFTDFSLKKVWIIFNPIFVGIGLAAVLEEVIGRTLFSIYFIFWIFVFPIIIFVYGKRRNL